MVRRVTGAWLFALIAACGAPSLTFLDDNPLMSASGPTGSGGASTSGEGGSAGVVVDAATGGSASLDASTVDSPSDLDAVTGDAPIAPSDVRTISCVNELIDGEESDVDCGGTGCPRCGIGKVCRQDTDCIGAYCRQGFCAQGSCVDRVKNLKETDVDCGGGDCPPCGVGASCISYLDCAQQSCIAGKCQSMSCDDHFIGSGETDVDCGGSACAACAAGKHCLLARDCAGGICTAEVCATPTCSDGVQNGTETAKDCGGSCAPCVDGSGCMIASDCASAVCSGAVCKPPSCTDKVKNQGEGDVDCGGPCGKCGTGSVCVRDLDCASGNCAGTCQPCPKDMVSVPTQSGSSYCVDAREVTNAAYGAFVASGPSVSLFPTACGGKTSFAPTVPLDPMKPTYPVTSVDWCQAYAYCAGIGRHLCGRIGGGASLSAAEQLDQVKSEWFNACSKGGTLVYPYGATYVMGACVDNRTSFNSPRPVGSSVGCVGGYPGLRDMSGNVQEWEDNCVTVGGQASLNDNCMTRGGGYNDGSTGVTCATMDSTRHRSQADAATGFRCCR